MNAVLRKEGEPPALLESLHHATTKHRGNPTSRQLSRLCGRMQRSMVRVVVAGGTGSVGRTLVDAIVETGRHAVFVLSRKETHTFSEQSSVTSLLTNYNSVDAIARILSQNEIHTVISTLSGLTPDVAEAELRLIRGAAASTTVKRFAPSEFGFNYDQSDERVPLAWKQERRRAIFELKQYPQLEHTLFQPGFFMDYFGLPHVPSYLPPEACFLDIPRAKAAVPGSGDDLVVWTYSKDVGRFVARSLDLQAWPERSTIVGDRMTYNDLIRIVEKVRDVKFDVTYDSLESMRAGRITELPNYASIYEFFPQEIMLKTWASFGVAIAMGACDLKGDYLNQVLPDVKAQNLSNFISTYWSGK